MMGNEVLQFAKMKAAGQRDFLPSVDYVSQFRPDNYEFGMPDYQFGSGYGRAAGQIFSDVISGKSQFSDSRYGLSQAGQRQYQAVLDDLNTYATDNADFIARNKDNPQVLADHYMEHVNRSGLLPSGEAGFGDYAAGLFEKGKEFFTGESAGELTEIGDTPDFRQNMTTGLKNFITENPEEFVKALEPRVRQQYMQNRFGNFGEFLSNLTGSIGQGAGNIFKYIMDLLGKVSPAFQKMVSNISSRFSPETGDATGGANA
jgi:hypothetical protein